MECCTGDYCNNGSFPYLPPQISPGVPDDTANDNFLKMCFAIFGPIVVLGAVAIGVAVLCMRKNHKKRLVDARIQQDADTYYASDDLLKRTHACGDSTLRVS